MAKKKKRTKKQRAQAAARRSKPRQRRGGPSPLKSMAIGGLIVVALMVFFTVRFGERTLFNRLVDAFGGDEAETEQSEPNGEAAPAKPAPKPGVAKGAAKAAPMETVTDDEQDELDDLIEQKTK